MAIDKKTFIKDCLNSGKQYGYPECCIKYMIDTVINEGDKDAKFCLKMSYIGEMYTGFIPCPKHALEISKGLTTLSKLIKGRNPILMPFPNDWRLK